jgi:hypothetical protein
MNNKNMITDDTVYYSLTTCTEAIDCMLAEKILKTVSQAEVNNNVWVEFTPDIIACLKWLVQCVDQVCCT